MAGVIKCDASSFRRGRIESSACTDPCRAQPPRLIHLAHQIADFHIVLELLTQIGGRHAVRRDARCWTMRSVCVAVNDPTVSRTLNCPGTAIGPFGPSGRLALIHGPG